MDLMDSFSNPGEHQFLWSAQTLPAGVYLVRLETAQQTVTKKALLIK